MPAPTGGRMGGSGPASDAVMTVVVRMPTTRIGTMRQMTATMAAARFSQSRPMNVRDHHGSLPPGRGMIPVKSTHISPASRTNTQAKRKRITICGDLGAYGHSPAWTAGRWCRGAERGDGTPGAVRRNRGRLARGVVDMADAY